MKFKVLVLSAIVAFAFGCKKYEYDIHPPLLTGIDISGVSENVVLRAGSGILDSLYYRVEDNKGVDRVRITTVKGFKLEKNPVTTASDWHFIYDVKNDRASKSEGIPFTLPDNATPGTYRVKVEITDVNNNVVTEKSLDFVVVAKDDSQPVVAPVKCYSTSDSNYNETIYVNRTEQVFLNGVVASQRMIDSVKVELWNESKNVWNKRIAVTDGLNSVDLSKLNSEIDLRINSNLPAGNYRLAVYVKDVGNNVGARVFNLSVSY